MGIYHLFMHYSIIVPAYNEEKLLPKTLACLNKIEKDLEPDFRGEIIVVDNNSTDNTAKIAREHNATVVFEKENCIAGARNAGAKIANGKFLIFVDADTIVQYELIKKSLDSMQEKKACAGGTIIHFDIDKIPLSLRFFTWLWHFYIKISPLAAGSYVFCLKEAWQATGGFDEKLYASEEIWFSIALRKWGKKRNLPFIILDTPVVTSARKIKQYSSFQLLSVVIILMIFPWGIRNRKLCHVWYERE
jgi:glycosyltransferase involved in cell wall biosynthesis